MHRHRALLVLLGLLVLAVVLAMVMPSWLRFLVTVALAKGLVVLSLLLLMRAGLVSFGHGLYYGLGAYAAGLSVNYLGIRDAIPLLLGGIAVAAACRLDPGLSPGALSRDLLCGPQPGVLDDPLRRPGQERSARQHRRLRPAAPDLPRLPAGRRHGRSDDVHDDRAGGAGRGLLLRSSLSGLGARPCRRGGARERAARRVPRHLGLSPGACQIRHVGGAGGRRRCADGDDQRPHRPRGRLLDHLGRVRLRGDPERHRPCRGALRGRPAVRSRPDLRLRLFAAHLATRPRHHVAARHPVHAGRIVVAVHAGAGWKGCAK
jgi:hypothetical protein